MSDERSCLALILGASAFPQLGLPESKAFATSARALEQYLAAQSAGPTTYRVETLFDSDLNVMDQCTRIAELLDAHPDATELLLYYVGHGAFIRGSEYFLALRGTRRDFEDVSGLRSSTLASVVARTFANRRVFVLLDCCFAGEALREFQGDVGTIVERRTFREFPRRGTALLVASSKDEPAVSPATLPHTMFCEGLMTVLTEGVKGAGRYLSLGEVGRRLHEVLSARFGGKAVLPEIHSPRQVDGDVAAVPLFPNPAHSPTTLDRSLVGALRNEIPRIRIAAVDALIQELEHADDDLRALILATLGRLAARDDSTLVRERAAAGLPGAAAAQHEPLGPSGEGGEPSFEPAPAGLSVSAAPSRTRIYAGDSVSWLCTVANTGKTEVRAIELTDREGTRLRPPFDLGAGDRADVRVEKRYGGRGTSERFAALGRTPDGQLVSAEDAARIRVRQRPAVTRVAVDATAPVGRPAGDGQTAPRGAARAAGTLMLEPAARAALSLPRFRAALREVKATADLGDTEFNALIRLVDEGERHYRVATGRLARPPDWSGRVGAWQRSVAAERGDPVVLVRLAPPNGQEIVDGLRALAERIEARTGVAIPVDEFPRTTENER